MYRLFSRPFLALFCTTVSCISTAFVAATDEIPFPEVIPVEKPDLQAPCEELAEVLPFIRALGYDDEAYLQRIHKDAYYHLLAFSDTGEIVQLHDTSKWFVHPSQRHIVLKWFQSDELFIKPCSSCFSSYQYVLYNRKSQEAVEVNLKSSPLPMVAHSFRIVNIEPYNRLVQLSDNTIWQIDSQDYHFAYWQIGQRVLVGVNNGWRAAPLPHILINVDLQKEPYSQADFYGYPVGY